MRNVVTRKLQGAMLMLVLTLMLIPVQAQAQIGDDQIMPFAKAQMKIAQIQQSYNNDARLSEATTAEEKQSIVQEANDRMVSAIEGEGLNVELYNTILSEAQNDEKLKQRIGQAMQGLQ